MRKIEKKGYVLYFNDDPTCFDIDITPGVETVELGYESGLCTIELLECKKTFPNVTKLVIDESVVLISLSNRLFPNVRWVESRTEQYKSGPYLVSKKFSDKKYDTLENTFCLRKDEVVNLEGIKTLKDGCLDGCESLNFINTEAVRYVTEESFEGSSVYNQPAQKSGCVMVGSILLKTNSSAEKLEIPKEATVTIHNMDLANVKEIRIHNLEILVEIRFEMLETIIITQDMHSDVSKLENTSMFNQIKNIEVEDGNEMYSSIDGVLYNKDKTILYRFPNSRSGEFRVPDGIKTIGSKAFAFSKVNKVMLPDSLLNIENSAFMKCEDLEYIDFGNGITNIGDNEDDSLMFYGCTALKNVMFPSQIKAIGYGIFFFSGLENIILNEGLEYIGNAAFDHTNIKQICIPKSVKKMSRSALSGIPKVFFKTDSGRLPYGILKALLVYSNSKNAGIQVYINDRLIYLSNRNYGKIQNKLTVTELEKYAKEKAKRFADRLVDLEDWNELRILLECNYLTFEDAENLIHKITDDIVMRSYLLDYCKKKKEEEQQVDNLKL